MTGQPALPSETMAPAPIVCAIDSSYVMPLLTAMNSLARSKADGAVVRFIVLHATLTVEEQRTIISAEHEGLAVEILQVPPAVATWPVSDWASPAVYLRLSIADALPEFRRALYVDVDVLVLGDLSDLLTTGLRGAPLAAVRDSLNPVLEFGIGLPGWRQLAIPGNRDYFNSGVMLLDLDVCRRIGLFERARWFLAHHPDSVRFWDQDALNWAADDAWRRLDRHWNTFAVTPLISRKDFVHYAEHVIPLAELVKAEPDAAILHFAGPDKPWQPGYPPGPIRDLYRDHEVMAGVRPAKQRRPGR